MTLDFNTRKGCKREMLFMGWVDIGQDKALLNRTGVQKRSGSLSSRSRRACDTLQSMQVGAYALLK